MRTAVAVAVAMAIIGMSHGKDADAAIRRPTQIGSQALASALLELAKQREIQVLWRSELVGARTTSGAVGDLTFEEALGQLLDGSGLTFEYLDTSAISIVPTKLAEPAESAPPAAGAAAQGALPSADAKAGELAPKQDSTTQSETEALPAAAEPASYDEKGLLEILVRGSRLTLNVDIERTEDDVQPYVVYSAEEIRSSMATNLEDFFRSRLPMNTVSATNSQNTRSGSNISEINLRGLGIDETLILVNGRRQPGVSNIARDSSSFGQPDINGISLASIERIEVLPATAAGIYGGGATGGVINIVLKTNFTGLDMIANYSNTFDSDSGEKRIAANGGMSLEGGRTTISLSADYSEQNPMYVNDRDFAQRARDLALRNDPESFASSSSTLLTGTTPNIRSRTSCSFDPDVGEFVCGTPNLTLRPEYGGTNLGSPLTHVPAGYTGNVQDLVANAGTLNLDIAPDLRNGGRSLQNNPRTNSLNLTVNREFSDWMSMFVNVSRSENVGNVYFMGLINEYEVDAGAPTNPFEQSITVTVPFPGYSFKQGSKSEALNSVLGASFALPRNWGVHVEGSWGRSRSEYFGGTPFLNFDVRDPVNPWTAPPLRTGLQTAVRRGDIDVLRDVNANPLDLSEFTINPYPNLTQTPADTIATGAVLRVSGPALKLPAGSLTLSGALEHRRSKADEVITYSAVSFSGSGYGYYPDRETTTDSMYLEAFVPIVSAANDKPWLKMLDLQLSVRRDRSDTRSVLNGSTDIDGPNDRPVSIEYTESGVTATGYTLGFRVAPTNDVILRSSFSHGFLPPSVAQISPLAVRTDDPDNAVSYYDPLRDFEAIGSVEPATLVSVGNPNLKPEESDSVSAGLIFTPRFLPGLRLSADYTIIRKKNEIGSVDWTILLERPDLSPVVYPGRLVRAPGLGDGLPGPITYLDMSLINIDRTTVSATDLQLDYRFGSARFGQFNVYSVVTYQNEYSRKLTVESPVVNSVGFHDGPLKWRGNVGLDWHRGPLSLGWNVQYYDSYLVYNVSDAEGSIDRPVRMQGSASIGSQSYHDFSFRYRFDDAFGARYSMLSGLSLSGGIRNVFDESPPIEANSPDVGYSTYGDPRLRRYTLQLSKSF